MSRRFLTAMLAALALSTSWVAAAATDVNQASVAELEAIKGIGPALSVKISSARQQAVFKDWDDLVDRVSGLGAGHARRFSEAGFTVAGKAYVAPAAAAAKAGSKAEKQERAESGAPAAKSAQSTPLAQPARLPVAATPAARDKPVRNARPF